MRTRLFGVYDWTNKVERKIVYLGVEMSDFYPELLGASFKDAERWAKRLFSPDGGVKMQSICPS